MESKSLVLAKNYLSKKVKIKIDRPLGSLHPRFNRLKYTSNQGYLEGVKAPDGDDLDAYLLGVDKPVDEFQGTVVPNNHRLLSDEEIDLAIEFQEKWSRSKHVIIR